jgi:trigger factor
MIDSPTGSVKVTTRPGARSSVVLEVEISPERVRKSVEESVRHLARRTKVPGFRPGKAPRAVLERALGVRRHDPSAPNPVYDDAKEHLFEGSVLDAVREQDLDVLSIPEPEWLSFEESTGAVYRVTLPVRPAVALGDYTNYPFGIQIDEIDDAAVDKVVEQLRDQNSALVPVEERGAQEGDYAVIRFAGSSEGQPISGAQSDRMPLVIGGERLLPGFEEQLVGLRESDQKTFKLTFPADYPEQELAGVEAEFEVELLELREKRLPEADDDFAAALGNYADMAALRKEVRSRLERNSLDRARHVFADRIIEYAVANASAEIPDLLVDRELEVMLDELRVRLAEQGIGYEDYLRATERDEQKVIHEFRPDAERRVKTLLVLSEIAGKEGVEVDDATLEAEVARSRERYAANPRLVSYLESERGRTYTRSLLRRSQTVESLVDRWIGEHPEFSHVQHLHDERAGSEENPEHQHDDDPGDEPVPAESPEKGKA